MATEREKREAREMVDHLVQAAHHLERLIDGQATAYNMDELKRDMTPDGWWIPVRTTIVGSMIADLEE